MYLRVSMMGAAVLLLASAAAAGPPAPGTSVANTTFTTAYGQSLSIRDLRGNVIILTYWMRDCEVCDVQVAVLDYYYRQRKDLGLKVLAMPAEDLTDQQLKKAFKGKGVFPLVRIRGPFEPLGRLPTTYIVDRYGKVRFAKSGLLDIAKLNEVLIPLLRQPQP